MIDLGAAHRLDDAAGQGTDIRAPVSADLGFVADAAEGHAHEPAAERSGDRAAERRLADAGRSDEAEDGAFEAADEAEHRDVVEDAVLDLVETVVVLVEHAPRVLDVEDVIGAFGPGEAEEPIEVIAADGRLGRHRRRAPQLSQLALCAGLHRVGQCAALDLGIEIRQVVAVVLPELARDRPELLLQVELPLVLEERSAHVVVDLALEPQQARSRRSRTSAQSACHRPRAVPASRGASGGRRA